MDRETIPNPDDLLLLPEVAEITRRSIDTLRWLRHCGKGPRGHRSGRRVYYRRGDVMAWLKEEEKRAEDAASRSPPPDHAACRHGIDIAFLRSPWGVHRASSAAPHLAGSLRASPARKLRQPCRQLCGW